jgi:hypothetical protein
MGKTIIQFGSSITLVVAYIVLQSTDPSYIATPFDVGLLVLNCIVGLISLFTVIRVFIKL